MENYYFEKEKVKITEEGIELFPVFSMGPELLSVPHMHSSLEILFCTSGFLSVILNGNKFNISEGEMILLRSNSVHSIYSVGNGKNAYYVLKAKLSLILDFTFKKNLSTYLLSLISKDKDAKTVWKKEESEDLFETLNKLIKEQNASEYGSDIAIKINVVTILLKILRDTENHSQTCNESEDLIRRIYELTLYINQHYSEDISAKQLCSKISLSYSYFSTVFKKITGMSFKEFLINTRIYHAEEELLSTDKSITDIATDCGFNNTSYFIYNFKKLRNITPLELRKKVKSNQQTHSS